MTSATPPCRQAGGNPVLRQEGQHHLRAARANLVELACRLTETLEIDEIQSIAPNVAPTVLGEVRSGRWRDRATPGALLLGLLDPQSDPLDKLGDYANAEALVKHGVFERIIPTLPFLTRVAPTSSIACWKPAIPIPRTAPPRHHHPSNQRRRASLERVKAGVKRTITSLPTEAPAAAVRPHARSVTTAEVATDEVPDLAPDRYAALTDRIPSQEAPASTAATDALIYGIEAAQAIYDKVYVHLDGLLDRVLTDPTTRNRVALAGLTHGASRDDHAWTALLTTSEDAQPAESRAAAQRLTDDIKTVEGITEHTDLIGTSSPK